MQIAYICSPYRGMTERNRKYAKLLTSLAIEKGYAPVTTHLYLPYVLDDEIETERQQALKIGQEILKACDLMIVGTRYGISDGMRAEIELAKTMGLKIRYADNDYIKKTYESAEIARA